MSTTNVSCCISRIGGFDWVRRSSRFTRTGGLSLLWENPCGLQWSRLFGWVYVSTSLATSKPTKRKCNQSMTSPPHAQRKERAGQKKQRKTERQKPSDRRTSKLAEVLTGHGPRASAFLCSAGMLSERAT